MVFLRHTTPADNEPMLVTERLFLRYPQSSDYLAWAEVREQSRDFLRPWEPTWPVDELTRPAFRRRLRRYGKEIREDEGYPFFVFRRADEKLMGGCILSNVRRGASQACSLGYWIGEAYARQGLMGEALDALLPHIFVQLRLRRVEAACLAANEPSRRLLARLGFQQEGIAREYLKIAGEWQDHLLFALLQSDFDKNKR